MPRPVAPTETDIDKARKVLKRIFGELRRYAYGSSGTDAMRRSFRNLYEMAKDADKESRDDRERYEQLLLFIKTVYERVHAYHVRRREQQGQHFNRNLRYETNSATNEALELLLGTHDRRYHPNCGLMTAVDI